MTGILMAAGRKVASAPAATVSGLSPGNQSSDFTTQGTGPTGRNFTAESVSVTNGTPTSYNWYFTNQTGEGAWSIFSGQGTASAVPRVYVAPDASGSVTINCDVVVNGVTYTRSAVLTYTLSYIDTGGGGGFA